MKENFSDFPTLAETRKGIEKLQNINWPDFSNFNSPEKYLRAIEKLIFAHFKIIPDTKRLFEIKDFNLPIFRVRDVDAFTNKSLFSEHSYPPINVTSFGRCNFPGNPVFYCSNNPMTALMEVVREADYKKRKFCISKWEIPDIKGKLSFQSFLMSDLHKENKFSTLRDSDIKEVDKLFNSKLNEDKKLGFKEFLKFINESFINDKNYNLSATLAYRTLYANHNLATDILMYPSIQTQYRGVNMAIHPNFVDNVLRIQRFYIVELNSFDHEDGKFNLTFLKYGYIDKNIIMWRNINPKDDIYKENFKEDFGGLIKPDFKWEFGQKS